MQWRIPFNKPTIVGTERDNINNVFHNNKYAGGGSFNKACNLWLKDNLHAAGALTTTSCTHALEMAALLCDLQGSDEVILPSYAFTSTATAFARCGARLKFVDISPQTMNIDPVAVEKAITKNTKVIVVLHYAGVSCDMQAIRQLAEQYSLRIVEDAAQSMLASYLDIPCGTLGDFGCFSFHETKNLHCGEGGALILKHAEDIERAEILLEKGTNRMQFFRGEVAKYEWFDMGSSYVPGELNTAFLFAQLEAGQQINTKRLSLWNCYQKHLQPLAQKEWISLPQPPQECQHNAHIFWIKLKDKVQRDSLIKYLKRRGIGATFHYIPLHSAPAGVRYGQFSGADIFTTKESERLVRLPIFYSLTESEIEEVVMNITDFLE